MGEIEYVGWRKVEVMYVSYDNEEQELVNVIRVKRVAGARRWRAQAQLNHHWSW